MEQPKNKKMTNGRIITIASALFIGLFFQQCATPSFDKAMMQAASELNKTCPIMIDKETRLDNALALPGNVFQYNYTLVNAIKDSIDIASFEEYMKPLITNMVKTNPDLKLYRDNEVTMTYYYKDMNGVFIAKISITKDLYAD
jgi:hypothetical protein